MLLLALSMALWELRVEALADHKPPVSRVAVHIVAIVVCDDALLGRLVQHLLADEASLLYLLLRQAINHWHG